MPGRRQPRILHVALPLPLRRCFDYIHNDNFPDITLMPGLRLSVPFGKKQNRVGIIINISDTTSLDFKQLKSVSNFIDDEPLFSQEHLKLIKWASEYYQHPIGEVVFGTMPALLRRGKQAWERPELLWRLSEAGKRLDDGELKGAPVQTAVFKLLRENPSGLTSAAIKNSINIYHHALQALHGKGLIEKTTVKPERVFEKNLSPQIKLNKDQTYVADTIKSCLNDYHSTLLEGVTGSGKTEVYIDVIKQVIANGRQALVLVPEIGLTPQLISRIGSQLNSDIVVMHSALSESQRLSAWLAARDGGAAVVLGTRSAVWTPLKKPGIFIVDEEHDISYKQQDGFRYSARDVAIMRGMQMNVPVLLGSATPSLESLQNINNGKFSLVKLPERAGNSRLPVIRMIDLRSRPMTGALSKPLMEAIKQELIKKKQTLLFLNRRGFSPVIMCHHCGWLANCKRCDIPLTYHKLQEKLICHHCNSRTVLQDSCPECGNQKLQQIGHGTERLTETLTGCFPDARILRIDRDSTRRRGSMQRMVATINAGDADIIVGTQMLAKGHHFPNLSLVGIIDTDSGLFSTDFRASERMAQLFIQVSGRAGRTLAPGTVLVQTHYPDHPLLLTLIHHGYTKFAESLLLERQQSNLPPFTYFALLRAEAHIAKLSQEFLAEARQLLQKQTTHLDIFGPIPAPIEKRAGRYRHQLLIQSENRSQIGRILGVWCKTLETLPVAKKVRWSLDVDPQDML